MTIELEAKELIESFVKLMPDAKDTRYETACAKQCAIKHCELMIYEIDKYFFTKTNETAKELRNHYTDLLNHLKTL